MRYLPRDQGDLRADRARSSRERVEEGYVPLVLGGDHSVALGTLGGMARAHGGPAACSGSTRTAT